MEKFKDILVVVAFILIVINYSLKIYDYFKNKKK